MLCSNNTNVWSIDASERKSNCSYTERTWNGANISTRIIMIYFFLSILLISASEECLHSEQILNRDLKYQQEYTWTGVIVNIEMGCKMTVDCCDADITELCARPSHIRPANQVVHCIWNAVSSKRNINVFFFENGSMFFVFGSETSRMLPYENRTNF